MAVWSCPLVWDAIYPNTLAVSYRRQVMSGAGVVAALAKDKKIEKFSYPAPNHYFIPVAIETFGVMGPAAGGFVKELEGGRNMRRERSSFPAIQYIDIGWLYKEEMLWRCLARIKLFTS